MRELKDDAPTGTDAIILSNEDFAKQKDTSWVSIAQKHFEVQVIFYLIRQDHWMMSWYNQNIKSAWNAEVSTLTPTEFLGRLSDYHWLDYKALLSRWSEGLDESAVYLGILERGQVNDSTADFFGRLFPGANDLDLNRTRLNGSLSPPVLEAKRRLNALKIPANKRSDMTAAMIQASNFFAERQPIYSPEVRNRIIGIFEDSNADIARTKLGREDGQLFLEGPVPENAPYQEIRLPDSTDELWNDIVVPIIRTIYSS